MNWSQIHITAFLWVGISVKTNTVFAFLEKHLAYYQWYAYHRLGTPGIGSTAYYIKYLRKSILCRVCSSSVCSKTELDSRSLKCAKLVDNLDVSTNTYTCIDAMPALKYNPINLCKYSV